MSKKNQPGENIELGDIARDTLTGFEGVVVCVSTWLHNCKRAALQPQSLNKDGKPHDSASFDMPQLVLVKKAVAPTTQDHGGPREEPSRGR